MQIGSTQGGAPSYLYSMTQQTSGPRQRIMLPQLFASATRSTLYGLKMREAKYGMCVGQYKE